MNAHQYHQPKSIPCWEVGEVILLRISFYTSAPISLLFVISNYNSCPIIHKKIIPLFIVVVTLLLN